MCVQRRVVEYKTRGIISQRTLELKQEQIVMSICLSLDRVAGHYEVVEVALAHNHGVYLPQTFHLMSSQRRISELQAIEIEAVDDSGIRPRHAHDLASRLVGGPMNLSYTPRDHKNHLQSRRQRELAYGQAGSMLKYFQQKQAENPSFQYTLQLDSEEEISTIFWADAKMCIDYAHFGDVIAFDTTFGTNKEYRPFGVFVGFNHFRETVIFGAALLFDETRGSFKWLFEAFVEAHNRKQPRAIFTDQDTAMGLAVGDVFTQAWHGLCTYHIMQNAVKHLCNSKVEDKEEDEEPHILLDFSACMYNIEDKAAFEEAFDIMRNKVDKKKASWLDSIYKLKEKWTECYMRDVFTLGMRSTQLSESFNSDLKKHLKSDFDIIRFLKHFERAVQGKRNKELDAEFEATKKLSRIGMETPMLLQTSEAYTPTIFEAFKSEYRRSMAACSRALDGDNTYVVTIVRANGDLSSELERIVVGDPLEQTASCSCFQFKRTGVLCAHALKVLDLMNIKLLPNHYPLKRWTREAKSGTIQDTKGRDIIEDPKLDAMLRYKFVSHKFHDFASEAASDRECILLVDNALDILAKQVREKLRISRSILSESSNVQPNVQQDEGLLSSARLKKKRFNRKVQRDINLGSRRHASTKRKTQRNL
uniref:SWIM-type domain-containing protein n=1 Tax=Triticum urartu TaxID=4572 RepID=A0A8R7Q4E2_TRIUA